MVIMIANRYTKIINYRISLKAEITRPIFCPVVNLAEIDKENNYFMITDE